MPTSPKDLTEKPKIEPDAKPEKDKQLAGDSPAATFIQGLIAAKPPKKEETKLEDEKEDDAKQKQDQKPKKKTPPAPSQPVIDEEKLGASIGKSIAEHTAKPDKAVEQEAKPKADDKDARRIAVLERMEQLDDKRYKGLSERYKENKTKLQKYAQSWEKENPGGKFDENADEHTDFIESLESQVDYDDDDYTEALADIRSEKKLEEKLAAKESKLDERLGKVERAEKAREEAPKIRAAAASAGNDFWKEMGEDFTDVVAKSGEINVAALKEISDADPVKYDIVVEAAQSAEAAAHTIYMLANNLATYDEKNPAHTNLVQFAMEQESAMLKRPAAERQDDEGRFFARKSEYERMTKDQRAKHWTFSPDDMTFMVVQSISKRAKDYLKAEDEKFNRRAKARGLITDEEKTEVTPNRRSLLRRTDDDDESTNDDRPTIGKPLSPSISTSPKLAAGKGGKLNSEQNGLERFAEKFLG